MARMRLAWCLFIRIMLVNLVFVDETKAGKTHCSMIEITNTTFHKTLEGIYKLKGPAPYNCNNRTVYKLEDKEFYLFYMIQGSWQGWIVGKYECVNKGYLSVGDRALYPEDVNATWEEYNTGKWVFNKDLITRCYSLGPKMKTKPPKIKAETKSDPSTSAVIDSGGKKSWLFSDRTMTIVMFVAVPTGCLVILALLVILCIVAGAHKSFIKKIKRDKVDNVSYDGKRVKLSSTTSDLGSISEQEETDSVFEVLADPEDASSEAATTPPTERAKH